MVFEDFFEACRSVARTEPKRTKGGFTDGGLRPGAPAGTAPGTRPFQSLNDHVHRLSWVFGASDHLMPGMITLMEQVFDAIFLEAESPDADPPWSVVMILGQEDQGVQRGQPIKLTGVGMISQPVHEG